MVWSTESATDELSQEHLVRSLPNSAAPETVAVLLMKVMETFYKKYSKIETIKLLPIKCTNHCDEFK